jgi:hypothetical protein
MEIRPSLLIPSMIKAMTDTVLPAVDPENHLANEQARLVIGMLHLMQRRLPLLARYDRTELRHFVELAGRLAVESRGGEATTRAVDGLAAAARAGERTLERAAVDPSDVERALFDLRARVGDLVRAIAEDGEAESRRTIRRTIIASSAAEIERARSWLAPQGWEGDPSPLPPIEELLSEKGKP